MLSHLFLMHTIKKKSGKIIVSIFFMPLDDTGQRFLIKSSNHDTINVFGKAAAFSFTGKILYIKSFKAAYSNNKSSIVTSSDKSQINVNYNFLNQNHEAV